MKSNNWLRQFYSKLEHFELQSKRKSNQVIDFLKKHRNITKFSTTLDFLVENQEAILQSNIKLNILSIFHMRPLERNEYTNLHNLLTTLKSRRFYKYFHLYFNDIIGVYIIILIHQICCHLLRFRTGFSVSDMRNLDELYFYQKLDFPDLFKNEVMDNLKNLKII